MVVSAITLINNPKDSFALDIHHLGSNTPNVIANSGADSLPDGNYKLLLSYQDAFGNPVSQDSTTVIFDTKTLSPTLSNPANNGNTGRYLDLNFSLPETPAVNSVKLLFSRANKTDTVYLSTGSSGSQNYSIDLKNIASGSGVSGSTINALDSGRYTIQLVYRDYLNNPVGLTTNRNIYIGNNKPVITATGNLNFCYGDSATLSSSAAHGNKWYLNDSNIPIDTNAVITVKNTGLYRVVSDFSNNSYNGFDSRAADAVLASVKQIPNTPGTQNISYYVQDSLSVALTADTSSGNSLQWYGTNATGGSVSTTAPVPVVSIPGTFNYYVTQLNTVSGCESPRAAIVVTVLPLPDGVSKNGKPGTKEVLQRTGKLIDVIKN